jgi:Fic family protein
MKNLNDRIVNLPASLYMAVAQIDGLNGQWKGGLNLSPQTLGRLKRSALATSTGASTRIEGALLSDEEVEDLMRGLSTQKMTDRDTQEARGYYELLQDIFDNYQDISLTENVILHLHNQLLKYSYKDERHKGAYKHLENRVEAKNADGETIGIIFETTPAYLAPKAMAEFVSWAYGELDSGRNHPLVVIGAFIVEFLKIHPFVDGNGRLSRILTDLLLLRAGYAYTSYVSHEKIIEDNKAEYYIALRKSQVTFGTDSESVVVWLEFFFSVLLTQAKQAVALLGGEDIEKLLSPQQLKVWAYLTEAHEATPGVISDATGVARATVSQALDRLLAMKKVERIGQGSTTRYRKL